MKVVRSPGVQDTHIHAVFLVLDPSRLDRNIVAARNRASGHQANGVQDSRIRASGALDEDLDLQILRSLYRKTTVIPVIAKADTITTKHMNVLKKSVWESIKAADLDPLEALGLDDDSDSNSNRIDEEEEDVPAEGDEAKDPGTSPPSSPNSKRLSSQSLRRHKAQEEAKEDEIPFLPLSIISPDLYEPAVIGRQFPWGFADPYNDQHCDFTRLKEAVFSEWRGELREASREQWYEGWRTSRLKLRDLPYRQR
jgi:septin family protein